MIFRLLNGFFQFAFSSFWIFICFQLLYNNHFAGMLYSIIYPDWLLKLGMILGGIGLKTSFIVLIGVITIKKGYLIIVGLLVFGIIADFLSSLI